MLCHEESSFFGFLFNVKFCARLCLPEGPVKTIVFAIHGTGPNTYLNKRSGFNFYDVMAEGFCSQGVAFFSYNRRGVEVGDTAEKES
jgi:hypothetical protein